MYTDTLTWQDFFEQMAVDSIKQSKALMMAAESAGFKYDATEELKAFKDAMKENAAQGKYSLGDYLIMSYGPLATMNRVIPYVEESIVTGAYYRQLMEEKAPSDEEIQNYYEENRSSYDSVDYRLIMVEAELPTEPTPLADVPEEGTEDEAGEEGDAEEEAYQPSEAEIAAAMAIAKEKADKEESKVLTDGELYEGALYSSLDYTISDWLFDDTRQKGDTAVLENSSSHKYYVVAFVDRYLDESLSVQARVIITDTQDGQAILDEWTTGGATEENFIELFKKYDEANSSSDGEGMYTELTRSGMEASLTEWLFAADRKPGDTTSITVEGDSTYILYYVGQGEPEWKLSIKSTLLSDIMAAYIEEITAPITLEDPKGRLNYLIVEAQEAAAQEEAELGEDGSTGEETSLDEGDATGEEVSTE